MFVGQLIQQQLPTLSRVVVPIPLEGTVVNIREMRIRKGASLLSILIPTHEEFRVWFLVIVHRTHCWKNRWVCSECNHKMHCQIVKNARMFCFNVLGPGRRTPISAPDIFRRLISGLVNRKSSYFPGGDSTGSSCKILGNIPMTAPTTLGDTSPRSRPSLHQNSFPFGNVGWRKCPHLKSYRFEKVSAREAAVTNERDKKWSDW